MATIETPKIFISYSWTTPKHSTWVRMLAERLTQDGVQVILDQWDLKEGQDKYAFMERMVSDSDIQKVLLIIDKRYAEKANAREGGVGTESQIVSPKVYDSAEQEKFIPIVTEVDGEGKAYLPTYLKSRIYLDFVDPQRFEDEYERLLRIIYDRRSVKRPPLGAPPSHILEPDPVPNKVIHKLNRIKDFFFQQNPTYKALIQDYLRTLSEALEDFRMDLSNPSLEIDEVVMESINSFMPYRNDFIDLASFCASSVNTEDVYDEFFDFFERIIPYLFRTATMPSWNPLAFDNYKFIAYELFLYYAAILLKERRFNTIDKLLSKQFHYIGTAPEEKGKSWDYSVFCKHVSALEELRKARLKLRFFSCTGEIIKERADRKDFDFERLMEVDYILFVRNVLHLDYSSGRLFSPYWFPRCLPYAYDHNSFTFILRAAYKEHFQNLAIVLGVTDKDDLLRRWALVRQNLQLNHVGGDWVNPESLLCLNKLDTQ